MQKLLTLASPSQWSIVELIMSLLKLKEQWAKYYMTQQFTEKSDIYSFGVVMLELITARRPIERGKYIVRVVQIAMDRTKDLYNLHKILDPALGLGSELKGLENFVDLAILCLEDLQAKRPRMGEVVKEIENIIQLAALNSSDILASN